MGAVSRTLRQEVYTAYETEGLLREAQTTAPLLSRSCHYGKSRPGWQGTAMLLSTLWLTRCAAQPFYNWSIHDAYVHYETACHALCLR